MNQWCGLRPSVLRQDRSETKISVMVLYALVRCCVVKHDLVTRVVIMILKDLETFQVLFIVSLFCAWNITNVEINMVFTYLKVKFVKCLCLPTVVLVLLFWSWSFLVLFTSLAWTRTQPSWPTWTQPSRFIRRQTNLAREPTMGRCLKTSKHASMASTFFTLGNGTRQGGVLLFVRNVRDLLSRVASSKVGCNVGHVYKHISIIMQMMLFYWHLHGVHCSGC